MDLLLLGRELNNRRGGTGNLRFHNSLVRRLKQSSSLPNRSHACSSTWSGGLLVVCAEDCTLRLWDTDRGCLQQQFDPGHTDQITCVETLPGTGGSTLVTAGPSNDIRLIDLHKGAVRPYSNHASNINAILPLSTAVFVSGGADGCVRLHDSRLHSSSNQAAGRNSLLVDQRTEAVIGRSGMRVAVNSMTQDPCNQQYIATGGGDALVRVYDVRMMRVPDSAAALRGFTSRSPPPWCYCLAPSHLRASNTWSSLRSQPSIASVQFDCSGKRLLASYAQDAIYAFDVCSHGVSYDALGNAQAQHAGSQGQRSIYRGHLSDLQFGGPSMLGWAGLGLGRNARHQAGPTGGAQGQASAAAAGTAPGTAAAGGSSGSGGSAGRRRVSARRSGRHGRNPQPAGAAAARGVHAAGGQQDGHTEVIISAEVHLLGPDGSVLHTARLPLHRAVAPPGHQIGELGLGMHLGGMQGLAAAAGGMPLQGFGLPPQAPAAAAAGQPAAAAAPSRLGLPRAPAAPAAAAAAAPVGVGMFNFSAGPSAAAGGAPTRRRTQRTRRRAPPAAGSSATAAAAAGAGADAAQASFSAAAAGPGAGVRAIAGAGAASGGLASSFRSLLQNLFALPRALSGGAQIRETATAAARHAPTAAMAAGGPTLQSMEDVAQTSTGGHAQQQQQPTGRLLRLPRRGSSLTEQHSAAAARVGAAAGQNTDSDDELIPRKRRRGPAAAGGGGEQGMAAAGDTAAHQPTPAELAAALSAAMHGTTTAAPQAAETVAAVAAAGEAGDAVGRTGSPRVQRRRLMPWQQASRDRAQPYSAAAAGTAAHRSQRGSRQQHAAAGIQQQQHQHDSAPTNQSRGPVAGRMPRGYSVQSAPASSAQFAAAAAAATAAVSGSATAARGVGSMPQLVPAAGGLAAAGGAGATSGALADFATAELARQLLQQRMRLRAAEEQLQEQPMRLGQQLEQLPQLQMPPLQQQQQQQQAAHAGPMSNPASTAGAASLDDSMGRMELYTPEDLECIGVPVRAAAGAAVPEPNAARGSEDMDGGEESDGFDALLESCFQHVVQGVAADGGVPAHAAAAAAAAAAARTAQGGQQAEAAAAQQGPSAAVAAAGPTQPATSLQTAAADTAAMMSSGVQAAVETMPQQQRQSGGHEQEQEQQGAAAKLRAELQLPCLNRAQAEQQQRVRCAQWQEEQQHLKHLLGHHQPAQPAVDGRAGGGSASGLMAGPLNQQPMQPEAGAVVQQGQQHQQQQHRSDKGSAGQQRPQLGRKRKRRSNDNAVPAGAGADHLSPRTAASAAAAGADEEYIAGMSGVQRLAEREAIVAAGAAGEQPATVARPVASPVSGAARRDRPGRGGSCSRGGGRSTSRPSSGRPSSASRSGRAASRVSTGREGASKPQTRSSKQQQQEQQQQQVDEPAQPQQGVRHSRRLAAQRTMSQELQLQQLEQAAPAQKEQRRKPPQKQPARQAPRAQRRRAFNRKHNLGDSSCRSSSSSDDGGDGCDKAALTSDDGAAAIESDRDGREELLRTRRLRLQLSRAQRDSRASARAAAAALGVLPIFAYSDEDSAAARVEGGQPASSSDIMPGLNDHMSDVGSDEAQWLGGGGSDSDEEALAHMQGMHDPMFPNLIPPGAASPSQEGSYSSRGYAVKFSGHRDTPTSSNVAWMGNSSQYVVSGSNDGSLFVWDSHTGEVVNIVRGGGKAIQRVQVHPDRLLVASTAAEPVVRLWSPEAEAAITQQQVTELLAASRQAAAADGAAAGARGHPGLPRLMGMLQQIGQQLMGGLLEGGLQPGDRTAGPDLADLVGQGGAGGGMIGFELPGLFGGMTGGAGFGGGAAGVGARAEDADGGGRVRVVRVRAADQGRAPQRVQVAAAQGAPPTAAVQAEGMAVRGMAENVLTGQAVHPARQGPTDAAAGQHSQQQQGAAAATSAAAAGEGRDVPVARRTRSSAAAPPASAAAAGGPASGTQWSSGAPPPRTQQQQQTTAQGGGGLLSHLLQQMSRSMQEAFGDLNAAAAGGSNAGARAGRPPHASPSPTTAAAAATGATGVASASGGQPGAGLPVAAPAGGPTPAATPSPSAVLLQTQHPGAARPRSNPQVMSPPPGALPLPLGGGAAALPGSVIGQLPGEMNLGPAAAAGATGGGPRLFTLGGGPGGGLPAAGGIMGMVLPMPAGLMRGRPLPPRPHAAAAGYAQHQAAEQFQQQQQQQHQEQAAQQQQRRPQQRRRGPSLDGHNAGGDSDGEGDE